jgi:glycosyltransferase involved in cell wall biosynthesis
LTKGGAEVSAYTLFRGLRHIGVDAIFIGACETSNRHRLAFADEHEFAVYYDEERYDHLYHLAPRSVEKQLIEIAREQRIDIFNFHHFLNVGLNSMRAMRAIPGGRCFYTIHEFLAICHNHGQMVTRPGLLLCSEATPAACVVCFPELLRTQFAMRKQTVMDALTGFDGFFSPSQFLADRFAGWGLERDRIAVIENGLQGSAGTPHRARTDSVWTFGFFGQINPFKGVDVILDAAEKLSADSKAVGSMRIRIHGTLVGQPQAFVERFNSALKNFPFLSYAGAYDSNSVYQLMSDCDYILVPSTWWENSPVVIQEAYSVRTPVICSGIGGLAEKVHDGKSGLHFRRGDPSDLLRAMKQATDSKLAKTLREGIPPVTSAADMARSYARLFFEKRELRTSKATVQKRAR